MRYTQSSFGTETFLPKEIQCLYAYGFHPCVTFKPKMSPLFLLS